jgi:hypothetical protein
MASSQQIKVKRLAVGALNGLFGCEKMDAEFLSSDVRSSGMLSFLLSFLLSFICFLLRFIESEGLENDE